MNTKSSREERFAAWTEEMMKAEATVTAVVKTVVDKYDPEQLLKIGCPSDEYDSVCSIIAGAIVREGMHQITKQELGNLIAFAWQYEFGPWTTPVRYYSVFYTIAEEIHPLIPEYDLRINSQVQTLPSPE
jgi:hypothetical protein